MREICLHQWLRQVSTESAPENLFSVLPSSTLSSSPTRNRLHIALRHFLALKIASRPLGSFSISEWTSVQVPTFNHMHSPVTCKGGDFALALAVPVKLSQR